MILANEHQADWFVELITKMSTKGYNVVDVDRSAELAWAERCSATTAKTVWGGVGGGCRSWYNKANVAKRDQAGNLLLKNRDDREAKTGGGDVLVYTGGFTKYVTLCDELKHTGLTFE